MPVHSKSTILDASSAIILCKTHLHFHLVRMYEVIMPQSVYREITSRPYPGSHEYRRLAAADIITVLDDGDARPAERPGGLDKGEYEVIRLFEKGRGTFIITDDGPAARYCRKTGIPFINALLFPLVLKLTGRVNRESCSRSMREIIEAGRYSKEVIRYANSCRPEDIDFSLP